MTADHKQVNSTVRYQLIIEQHNKDPLIHFVRDTWEEAADDAVNTGWAEWENEHVLKLKDGAKIERVREAK